MGKQKAHREFLFYIFNSQLSQVPSERKKRKISKKKRKKNTLKDYSYIE